MRLLHPRPLVLALLASANTVGPSARADDGVLGVKSIANDLENALAEAFYWWGRASYHGPRTRAQVYVVRSGAVPHLCAVFGGLRVPPYGRVLEFNLVVSDGRAVLEGERGTTCDKGGAAALRIDVGVPTDPRANVLHRRTAFTGEARLKLQRGLRGIFLANAPGGPAIGPQHFFVGPMTVGSCQLPVLWLEEKKYWFLPVCGANFDLEGGIDYALAAPIGLWKARDRRFVGADAVIANLVIDGELLELVP